MNYNMRLGLRDEHELDKKCRTSRENLVVLDYYSYFHSFLHSAFLIFNILILSSLIFR